MAFQATVFKTRSLTALAFVLIMGVGLFFHPLSYSLLFLFLLTVSWVEYSRLIDRIGERQSHPYILLGWILNGWALFFLFAGKLRIWDEYSLFDRWVLPFHLAGFILLILGTLRSHSISVRHWLLLFVGNLYLSMPFALAACLYGFGPFPERLFFPTDAWWVVMAIATMWVNDTVAYLMGSWIGRTPFSKISPKKTWEGTLSGVLGATWLVGWMIDLGLDDRVFPSWAGYLLIFLLAVAGTLGDLFESKLKRLAGVKDSGRMMPGHGGVLDRFDSLLFALPVLYLFLRVISLVVD